MLFDPSFTDRAVDAGVGASWQPPVAAVAQYRPADCVLTLPDVSEEVPASASVKWRNDASLDAIVLEQFRHGPLRAEDVEAPVSPVDAFRQAFFAWVRRQLPAPLRFLSFGLELCDSNAVSDAIQHQYEHDDFKPRTSLHLGVKSTDEWVHEVGAFAEPLRRAHPLLLHTIFNIVDRISGKTVLVRTPGWFLCEASCLHWEGNESATDEDVRAVLNDVYGDDAEVVDRYLPSELRPLLCPDEIRVPGKVEGRRVRSSVLSDNELRQLRADSPGMVARVCDHLLVLKQLLGKAGKSDCLADGYDAQPIYSGCTFVLSQNERMGELLDDHMNNAFSAGESSEYSRFISFSDTRRGIRAQYAQWSLGFRMLHHLDRLMALVVDPN
ncbi:PRTRC system protein F [Paraburkholderia sp. UYCP14C]|uniref:PRTRC system protein F n=1 Tax=Paraburkholderia sp. UYCP14C TaxID=2511130 RepID=UPI00101E9720|nr:PRTRC system protein F [Paraburkholderia sp. UYCP14C]RZF24243.1 PRTRC system protein F [Paraburkholderia sp. UYCP14C]